MPFVRTKRCFWLRELKDNWELFLRGGVAQSSCFSFLILPLWRSISRWRRSISFLWWSISSWWCCFNAASCSCSFRLVCRHGGVKGYVIIINKLQSKLFYSTSCCTRTYLKYISSSAACFLPMAPPASRIDPPAPPPFPAPFPSSPSWDRVGQKHKEKNLLSIYSRNRWDHFLRYSSLYYHHLEN